MWAEARDICESKGMSLATIENERDNEEFLRFFKSQKSDNKTVWIGLNDLREEGNFEWDSGSTASYRPWNKRFAPNNGGKFKNEHCVEAWTRSRYKGLWNDKQCYLRKPFVCSRY